ncbi:MAG: ABC transporter permease subunit [Oscillospiraceae bacterium]|jgi:putative aldouronate transport system permease protein|nr:ABC transporter permease subunit [Oscillospiraceae bacterium]
MTGTRSNTPAKLGASAWPKALRSLRLNGDLLLIFLPVAAYYIVFCYIPMSGVVMAFKDYKLLSGIWGSKWVGMKHFNMLFSTPSFFEVLRNTLVISLLKLAFGFPAPILLAILLNELRGQRFKRVVQTISYLPHFLSWVVLAGIFIQFLSPSTGPINILLGMMGRPSIFFLGNKATFVPTIVATHIWQTVGWGSIIYLAAISGIGVELYESAMLDGATRFQRIAYITLPGIMPTVTVLFILGTGSILNAGFDQIFNLYNEAVYSVADIIDTYVYRRGLTGMQYSYASAVGLFKNAIGFLLVFATNMIARRMGDSSLW